MQSELRVLSGRKWRVAESPISATVRGCRAGGQKHNKLNIRCAVEAFRYLAESEGPGPWTESVWPPEKKMGKDKPLGGKAAAAKEAKDKAAVAAAKEKGVEMCVQLTDVCCNYVAILNMIKISTKIVFAWNANRTSPRTNFPIQTKNILPFFNSNCVSVTRMEVRHILVEKHAKALEILEILNSGAIKFVWSLHSYKNISKQVPCS